MQSSPSHSLLNKPANNQNPVWKSRRTFIASISVKRVVFLNKCTWLLDHLERLPPVCSSEALSVWSETFGTVVAHHSRSKESCQKKNNCYTSVWKGLCSFSQTIQNAPSHSDNNYLQMQKSQDILSMSGCPSKFTPKLDNMILLEISGAPKDIPSSMWQMLSFPILQFGNKEQE